VSDLADVDERLRVAKLIAAEHAAIEDAAYAQAHFMREPYVPRPFGLQSVIEAGGDLEKATSNPNLLAEAKSYFGLAACERFIRDEDGERWEWEPEAENANELAQAEVAAIRADLGLDRAAVSPSTAVVEPGPREVGRSELQRRAAELKTHPAPSTPKTPHLSPPTPQRGPSR
jgi:hypothetical protein